MRIPSRLDRFQTGLRARRGVAIVMVMVVLAGLVALAVPFVFSMVLQGRSARGDFHEAQARAGAQGAVDHAIAQLHRLVKAPGYDPTPGVDTLDELKIDLTFPGVETDVRNARGTLWSAKVEDEQGKINITTAPPSLIGNLFGSSTLTESVNQGASVLLVADTDAFYSDGDPGTVDGYIAVGTDLLPYRHVAGSEIVLGGGLQYGHREGALVYDGRGVMVSDYKFRPGSDEFRPFRSIYEIKAAARGNAGLAIRADEFARIERFITIHSGLEGPPWSRAERISEQTFDGSREWFTVENGAGLGPGAFVRFIQAGRTVTHARVDAARLVRRGPLQDWTSFHTDRPVGVSVQGSGVGNDVFVSPMLYHPININTAPMEVIAACITGVCLAGNSEPLTRPAALLVASELAKRTYRDADDLRAELDQIGAKGLLTPNQRDAVFINATEYSSPKLRTSTTPFCYRSYGSFTIEGTGIVNAENGLQLARHTLRQTITLPNPTNTLVEEHSQVDFQKLLDQGMGQRVVTWPVAMNPPNSRFQRLNTQRQPDPNRGDISLAVGETGSHGRKATNEFIDHCDNPNDKAFMQEGYDIGERGPYDLDGVPGRGGFVPTTGVELWYRPEGGQAFVFDQGDEIDRNRVSVIYQPGRGLLVRVFDANLEGKYAEYLYPCNLDQGTWHHIAASFRSSYIDGQEVRVDGQLLPKEGEIEFSHGTRLAGNIDEKDDSLDLEDASQFPARGALRIGEEIIEYTRSGNTCNNLIRGARLSTAVAHNEGEYVMVYGYSVALAEDLPVGGGTLSEQMEKWPIRANVNKPTPPGFVLHDETGKLPVDDTTDFPPSGYLLVRGEVIYYASKSATSFNNLQRAQTLDGKSAKARNLNDGAVVRLVSFQVSDHSQYDPSGLLQIDNEDDENEVEWIAYGAKVTMDGKHYFQAQASYSNNSTIYQGDPPTKLSNERSVDLGSFRGEKKTNSNMGHAKGAKVIPVVRMAGPQCGSSFPSGRESHFGDGISTVSVIIRGQRGGDVRWIKRAHEEHGYTWIDTNRNGIGDTPSKYHFHYWAALNDFTSRRFPRSQSFFLRFPSGELPDIATMPRSVGASMDDQGQMRGLVDEVKVVTLASLSGRVALDMRNPVGLPAGEDVVYIETVDAFPVAGNAGNRFDCLWPRNGGVVKIEDELIYYSTASPEGNFGFLVDTRPTLTEKLTPRMGFNPEKKINVPISPSQWTFEKTVMRLSGLKRGVLGSAAADHPPGACAMLYDAAPITALAGGLGPTGDALRVVDAAGFPDEGYAWINDEVVSWTTAQPAQFQQGARTFTGCQVYHGRYGTQAETHAAGDIVQALPFRYWDRYAPHFDGNGMAYLQAGYHATEAIWETVQLDVTGRGYHGAGGGPIPNYCRPRVLVRFDGKPAWDSTPTNAEGGLYEFTGSGVFKLGGRGNRRGGGVRGDQIEIRVYWEYTKGAFASEDWKRTFALDALRATYRSPFVMRRLEQIEKR